MNKWSAHMLTGIGKIAGKMGADGTCRTDESGSACRCVGTRGAWRVARVVVVTVMAMVFGMAGFVASAEAAVALLSTSTSGVSTVASVTFSHNNPGGTDTMIIVGVGWDFRNSETLTSVTYAGQALTCSPRYGGGSSRGSSAICYRLNPATGINNVIVTTSANASGKPRIGTAVVVSGADQTAPAITGVGGSATTATLSGISSIGTDMVVGVINGYKATTAITPSGSTEIIEAGTSGTNMANMAYGMGAASLTWNNATTSASWGIGALVISEPSASCTETAPTVTFSTANQTIVTDGGNVVYNYTVTNNDTGGSCGSTTFNLGVSDSNSTDFTTTRNPTSVTLAEGATSATLTMTVTAATGADLVSDISTLTASEGIHPNGTATRTTDILIPDSTPPTAGTVTVSPDSGTKVPGDFTITTSFTDAETAVSGCDYTLNGSSWLAGVVSGAGPYICTKNIVALPDSTPLVINMRATSGGGTTTATAINRTVDATSPTVSITVAGTTSGTPVPFTVTFNEDVTGFIDTDVTLGGTAGATTAVVTGGPAIYTVNVSGMTGNGDITMDIAAGVTIDSVGNSNSVSNTATTTWSSCTEQATVSLVDPGLITAPTAITATLGGTGGSLAKVSTDGTTWYNSGWVWTPPSNGGGNQDFYAKATGSCASDIFDTNNPTALPYDTTGTNATYIETPSAAAASATSIQVTVPYLYDANNSLRMTIDYKLSSAGGWTNHANNVLAGGSPYTTTIDSPLTTGETYDIRITYGDNNDVYDESFVNQGTNYIVTINGILVQAWADNALLHNSLRFPGTTKHPAGALLEGWGQPGTYAGGITCDTCHAKDTGNIKRIKATISYPDGSDMPGTNGTSAAVSLLTVEDGTSDFGDDSAVPRTTSDKVCEVCHTYDNSQLIGTQFHAASQTVATGHYDNTDCIKCHEHKLGFAASCDSCHASPPIDASGLVVNGSTPGDATGSVTAGKHDKHANTLSYACNTCHTGWENTGEMPKAGQINVGIVTPGNDGGTYDGRSGGGGYNADAGTGTNVTTGGALTCAIYCHGNTIGGTLSTTKWNDAATISCGDCHKGDATQMQTGALGSHGRHAGDAAGQLSLTCDNCHGSVPSLGDTHMDGLVAWDVTALDGGTPTYNGNGTGSAGPAPTTYESCASVYCHSDVQNNGATVVSPAYDTPTWGGSVACGDCHGAAVTGRPTTGSHTIHNYACSTCHTGAGDETGKHADSEIDVAIDSTYGASAAYSQTGTNPAGNGYGDCSNVSCHGSGTPTWGATGSVACGDCHGDSGHTNSDNRDGAPPVDLAGLSGSFEVGKHQEHLSVSFSNTTDYCNLCHDGAGTGTGKHADGTVDIVFSVEAGASAAFSNPGTASAGTCSNLAVGCHGNANWDPSATMNCNDCHGFGGTDPDHVTDSRGISGTNCEHCHEAGHPQGVTATTILIPNNATVGIDYNSGGIHLLKTIKSVANTTESETCWSCHDVQSTKISEWGTNTQTNGLAVARNYDFGQVYTNSGMGTTTSKWIGTYWDSANFAYKAGYLNNKPTPADSVNGTANAGSTHAANPTDGVSGVDAATDIRCSYCHNVHSGTAGDGATAGAPYLRGTWKGNPYYEDGAPQSGVSYTADNQYGRVPRGTNSATQNVGGGGYWIDQNSLYPTNDGTAPTFNGTTDVWSWNDAQQWTEADSAGICMLCHNEDSVGGAVTVDTMNYFGTASADWVGTNGHSNAVIGGTGTGKANIYQESRRKPNDGLCGSTSDGACSDYPDMGYTHFSGSGPEAYGLRGNYSEGEGWAINPRMVLNRPRPWQWFAWGVSVDNSTTEQQYHRFSCSKCHNPHASRLPRLMITNCLDTKNNSWDDGPPLGIGAGETFSLSGCTEPNLNRSWTANAPAVDFKDAGSDYDVGIRLNASNILGSDYQQETCDLNLPDGSTVTNIDLSYMRNQSTLDGASTARDMLEFNDTDNGTTRISNIPGWRAPTSGATNFGGEVWISTDNEESHVSNLSSAQNCHRLGDTVESPNGTGDGWNNVTPW